MAFHISWHCRQRFTTWEFRLQRQLIDTTCCLSRHAQERRVRVTGQNATHILNRRRVFLPSLLFAQELPPEMLPGLPLWLRSPKHVQNLLVVRVLAVFCFICYTVSVRLCYGTCNATCVVVLCFRRVLASVGLHQSRSMHRCLPQARVPRPHLSEASHLPTVTHEGQGRDIVDHLAQSHDAVTLLTVQLRDLVDHKQLISTKQRQEGKVFPQPKDGVASVDAQLSVPGMLGEALSHSACQLRRVDSEQDAAAPVQRLFDDHQGGCCFARARWPEACFNLRRCAINELLNLRNGSRIRDSECVVHSLADACSVGLLESIQVLVCNAFPRRHQNVKGYDAVLRRGIPVPVEAVIFSDTSVNGCDARQHPFQTMVQEEFAEGIVVGDLRDSRVRSCA